jgi:lysophospholipase L1-like esterase
MSIDLYPRMDLEEKGAGEAYFSAAVGAASLFHRNHDALWPDFAGRDLAHRLPAIARLDLCADGATIDHALDFQLPRVTPDLGADARVVTVTAGGNDLLGGLFDGLAGLEHAAARAVARYAELADAVVETFPSAAVILTTVYDPTDGTGVLPGVSDALGPLPMRLLDVFNDAVAAAAARHDRAAVADIHGHFMGHGLSAEPGDLWYWAPSPIEPGATGASEIRRVWLEALETIAPSLPPAS